MNTNEQKFDSPTACDRSQVIYSLCVPGLFYIGDPPAEDQAEFTLSYDLRSPQVSEESM